MALGTDPHAVSVMIRFYFYSHRTTVFTKVFESEEAFLLGQYKTKLLNSFI